MEFFVSKIFLSLLFILIITQLRGVNSLCDVEVSLKKVSHHEREGQPSIPEARPLYTRLVPASPDKKNVIMCYYGSSAAYRVEEARLPIESIDSSLCTHYIYAFAGIDYESRIKSLDPVNDLGEMGNYKKFTNLKKSNPQIKTLLSVGGWNEGSFRYSVIAGNLTARRAFVQTALQFLETYNFDGLDLSWEFPSARGGRPEDKRNFAALIRELREALQSRNLLLVTSLSANKWTIDSGYDVPSIVQNVDYMNVMTYDYHGGWDTRTNHHAPLYAQRVEAGLDSVLNVNYSINYWISKGAPRSKLILGLPFFGRSFTLEKPDQIESGSPTSGPGHSGPFSQEEGSLAFNEICSLQKKSKWNVKVDPDQLTPSAVYQNQWVGYDDVNSVQLKVRFAKALNLGGVFIFSLENDDISGNCLGTKFPLAKAVKKEFESTNSTLPRPAVSINTNRKPEPGWTSTTGSSWSWKPSTSPNPNQWSWNPSSTTTTTVAPSQWTWKPSSLSTTKFISSSTSISTPKPSITTPSTIKTHSTASTTKIASTMRVTTSTTTTTTTTTASKPSTSTTTQSPTSTTTVQSTTKKSDVSKGLTCKYPGTFVNPNDCKKFYRCVRISIEEKYKIYEYTCPPNTVFDNDSTNCLWDYLVPNCHRTRDYPNLNYDLIAKAMMRH